MNRQQRRQAKLPVFHIPIGRHRENDEVVLCYDRAALAPALAEWFDTVTMRHPATLAAGACVIIGPNKTRYFDLATHSIFESRTADGAWQPSATSDLGASDPSIKLEEEPAP